MKIMEDWVGGRDSSTYVKERSMARLGWEEKCGDSSYSSFFDSSKDSIEVLARAYKTASDYLLLLEHGKKITIDIKGDSSGTDGSIVHVSTDVYDDKKLSAGDKQDVFIGLTLHEGCHLLYTDFNVFKAIKNPLKRQIYNILEDERIEGLLADSMPGLANFFEKVKAFYFGKYIEIEKKDNDLSNILDLFLFFVRYPKMIKEKDVKPYEEILTKIRDVIIPYPETDHKVLDCTNKIFEILKEEFKKNTEDGGKEGEKSDKEFGDEMAEEVAESLEIMVGNGLLRAKTGDSSDECVTKALDLLIESRLKILEEDIEKLMEPAGIQKVKDELKAGDKVVIKMAEDNVRGYKESYERIRQYIPSVSKILKMRGEETKLVLKSMRSGHLDTGKIAEAIQGVSTVYIREGKVKVDKVAVCVLIDESGSMGWGNRVRMAKDSAVLINEAIGKLPNVELFIYGHSADIEYSSSTDIFVYREPGKTKKFSLGSVKDRANNRDGEAIITVAKRVRSFTKESVLFFVLSDGSPAAHNYNGGLAVKHTKEMVDKIEKNGFTTMAICMEGVYSANEIYKKFIVINELSELPLKMGMLVKKAILTHTKRGVVS